MNNTSPLKIIFLSIFFLACPFTFAQQPAVGVNDTPAIQVLNFGTFHMGSTSDATKTEFDEHDKENQEKVHEIARLLARFDPTVILVELPPKYNTALQSEYQAYRENPQMSFGHPTEIELLAYEVGRLSDTKRIYGIDHKMGYNYKIGHEIENVVDPEWYLGYFNDPLAHHPVEDPTSDAMSLKEKLQITNQPEFLDFLMNVNADMLTHAGTADGYEGADEAAKFYQRNLRMYTNLNRIELQPGDRVFIVMGAAHTAFFRDFMRKSPKYQMVDTAEFLREK